MSGKEGNPQGRKGREKTKPDVRRRHVRVAVSPAPRIAGTLILTRESKSESVLRCRDPNTASRKQIRVSIALPGPSSLMTPLVDRPHHQAGWKLCVLLEAVCPAGNCVSCWKLCVLLEAVCPAGSCGSSVPCTLVVRPHHHDPDLTAYPSSHTSLRVSPLAISEGKEKDQGRKGPRQASNLHSKAGKQDARGSPA